MSERCSNCGAPKRGRKCEYCGTPFRTDDCNEVIIRNWFGEPVMAIGQADKIAAELVRLAQL